MELIYHEQGDTAAILTRGEIGPGDTAEVRELDADRIVRYDADGEVIEYQFFRARRHGVRVDDLPHRDALGTRFREAGFAERTWSTPAVYTTVRRRSRDSAAG